MSAQPSALAAAYTCKICRKTLTITGPPIVGENLPQKLGRVASMLAQHIGNDHQKEMLGIGIASQQVAGWLITEQFSHNDTELAKASNDARLQFRRNTRRVQISDEMIEKQIDAHLGLPYFTKNSDPDARDTLITMFRTLRDAIEEEAKPAA